MNIKYKYLINNTFIFALGNLGSKIILFLLVPLYTNYMTAEEYGTAELVSTFSQLIIPFLSINIHSALMRYAMKKDEKPENVLFASFVVLGFTLASTIVVTPLLKLYKPISEWSIYLAIQIVFTSISDVERAYLKVKNRNKAYAIISVFQTLILALTSLVLLRFFHAGIRGYLIAIIISILFTILITFIVINIPKELKNAILDKKLLKNMVLYSAPLILHNVSWWVIHSSDKIMIDSMINSSSLGKYTAATKIPSLINVLIAIFIQAWGLSTIVEIENEMDLSFFELIFRLYNLVIIGAAIIIVSFIKPFMNIYVGIEFRDAWKYTPLLISAAVFYAISCYFDSLFMAIKQTLNNMVATFIGAVFNIIINYIFIREVGVWGAIIGTVAAYFIIAHIRMFDMRRYIKLNIDFFRYGLNILVLLTQAVLVSFNISVVFSSLIAIALFIAINKKDIFLMKNQLIKVFKQHL